MYEYLANNLKKYRKQQGFNFGQAAEISGVAREQIGKYESQKEIPSLNTLNKLAKAYNCELSNFFENKPELTEAMQQINKYLFRYPHLQIIILDELKNYDLEGDQTNFLLYKTIRRLRGHQKIALLTVLDGTQNE